IVAGANFVGVYTVKYFEEKARKDKLWKVEATVPANLASNLRFHLDQRNIPYNYIDINKYVIFNAYCETQTQSAKIREILKMHDAKYFVSESKTL
ncbi:MAG: hypothetical protein J6S32_03300, partial [Clostridia bacterium]|nr:hypothetical protein [Clostridia bacterium]